MNFFWIMLVALAIASHLGFSLEEKTFLTVSLVNQCTDRQECASAASKHCPPGSVAKLNGCFSQYRGKIILKCICADQKLEFQH